jgi:2-polyprenyl-3-methyl-5-hydroxy-6-metoxy-1,4-benzoquinol methylase
MKIEYYLFDVSRQRYNIELKKLVRKPDIKKVLEVGGGANPLLSLDEIAEYGLEYTILDISLEELTKAPDAYNKLQRDITDPDLSLDGKYDLVCSRFLAEHVPSGRTFHRNILNLLREGGYAFHYFPTLYSTPFLTNLLLPEKLLETILFFFQPSRTKEDKFKAYYDWCYGPTRKNIKRLIELGYNVEEYIGFFGHRYYSRIKILNRLEMIKANLLVKYPLPFFTQFAQVLLKKRRVSKPA